VEFLKQILEIETHIVRNSELLSIKLSPDTELRTAPSLHSAYYFPQEGKTFNICHFSEQIISPNFLKIINSESKEAFFVSVPEVEKFPCPVKINTPQGPIQSPLSLYEVMIILLYKWEEGISHHRIISSIGTTFDKIGEVQNETIVRNFYDAPKK
jgi:hypothetical protein